MNNLFPVEPDTTDSLLAPHSTYLSLIQSVSHELRSTFGVISGLHSLLPLTSGEAERNDMFNRLHNNTEYAIQLFADLEDFCSLELGEFRVEATSFRLATALENVRKKALPMLQRRNADLLLNGDSEMVVSSDEEKVRRVVKNIIFHLTSVIRAQTIEIGWENRSTTWALTFVFTGEQLPEWLFMPKADAESGNIGRHVSLLVVRRLVSLLGGYIRGGILADDHRRWVSVYFPH